MENKETIITVRSISSKTSKAGKEYWAIDTAQEGTITCFEKALVEDLKVGNRYSVGIAQKDNWKNLRSIVGEVEGQINNKPEKVEGDKFVEARHAKDTSIYTSYVKDLVISGKELEEAIEIIKKAREAFK